MTSEARPSNPDRPIDSTAAAPLSRRALVKGAGALGVGAALAAMPAAAAPGPRVRSVSRDAADPTTLTIAMDGSPSDLDPHSAYDYRSVLAILGIYEGLVGLKDDKVDEYEGILAETWESNADKSTWTFHLRQGVTFHDGSPCDAAAILANYERLFTLQLGPVGVLARFVTDYKIQITAPDAKTIVFSLGRPQPVFISALASTYGTTVVNAAAMKKRQDASKQDWGHTWAQTDAEGMGTGPYKLKSFAPNDTLIMVKNDAYWGGWQGGHFAQIVLRIVPEAATRRQLIESGDADIVDDLTPEDVDALAKNANITLLRGYTTQVDYCAMTVSGPLATKEARQALCYAMPYDDVISGVYKGYAKQAKGGVAETVRGFSAETFTYTTDLAKAKDLLAKAGVAGGTKLTMMLESGGEAAKAVAQLLQANLAQLGIALDLQLVDTPTFTSSFYGDAPAEQRPNLYWWGWWPDYNDAYNHLYPQVDGASWGSKGANCGFYKNQAVDDGLATARDAADDATYLKAMADVQQTISRDDPPSIYFLQPQWTTLFRTGVTGVIFNPINIGTYNFYKMGRGA